MPDDNGLHHRRPRHEQNQTHPTAPLPRAPPPPDSEPPSRLRSWRFYIVWACRILLPLVYLLSTAKFVSIPDAPVDPTQPSATHNVPHTSALLLITHSRDVYLARTLHSLLTRHPGGRSWPILISKDVQDGPHPAIDAVISHFLPVAAARNITLRHVAHAPSEPMQNLSATELPSHGPFVNMMAYRRISRHYRWAISRAFEPLEHFPSIHRLVIVEDDMEIAPDFFNYFTSLAPYLDVDHDLYCVSAWNDNGISSLSLNASQLHRTDFFPGLGWMLSKRLWHELMPKWPAAFWDDWMRHPNQTNERQCIRPEVSRTANFGKSGVSQSFHFQQHISRVALANDTVDFSALDLSYIRADAYFDSFFSRMSRATRLRFSNYLTSRPQDGDVIAFYPDDQIMAIGKRTGIMTDHRNGMFRTSYHGVVTIPWNHHWAFVVRKGWEAPEGYSVGSSECC